MKIEVKSEQLQPDERTEEEPIILHQGDLLSFIEGRDHPVPESRSCMSDEFPHLPSSRIRITIDRLHYGSGRIGYDESTLIVGKLVAETSALTISVPDGMDHLEHLEDGAAVNVFEHARNEIVGIQTTDAQGQSKWSFILRLNPEWFELLNSPISFKLEVCADALEQLPSAMKKSDLSFVAPISDIMATALRKLSEREYVQRLCWGIESYFEEEKQDDNS